MVGTNYRRLVLWAIFTLTTLPLSSLITFRYGTDKANCGTPAGLDIALRA